MLFIICSVDYDVCLSLSVLFGPLEDMMRSLQVNTILFIQANHTQIKYNHHDTIFIFIFLQKEMNQTPEAEHECIENVPDLEIPSVVTLPTNSEVICRANGNSLS
jgi:hypothetical protein